MMVKTLILAGLVLSLAACSGRMNVRNAEAECAAQSNLSDGIGGEVRVGVNQSGAAGGVRLQITDQIFRPATTPEAFYDNCVFQKSGQGPTRTLVEALR